MEFYIVCNRLKHEIKLVVLGEGGGGRAEWEQRMYVTTPILKT